MWPLLMSHAVVRTGGIASTTFIIDYEPMVNPHLKHCEWTMTLFRRSIRFILFAFVFVVAITKTLQIPYLACLVHIGTQYEDRRGVCLTRIPSAPLLSLVDLQKRGIYRERGSHIASPYGSKFTLVYLSRRQKSGMSLRARYLSRDRNPKQDLHPIRRVTK